jgi:hypothetical protein
MFSAPTTRTALTILESSDTGIEEAGLASVKAAVDNAIDRHAAPLRTYEHDNVSDRFAETLVRVTGFDLYRTVDDP